MWVRALFPPKQAASRDLCCHKLQVAFLSSFLIIEKKNGCKDFCEETLYIFIFGVLIFFKWIPVSWERMFSV